MKKVLTIAVAGIGLVLFYFIYLGVSSGVKPNQTQVVATTNPPAANQEGYQERLSDSDQVTASVKPLKLSATDVQWEFEITLNTHSVELNHDLVKLTKLISPDGNTEQPLEWIGDPPEGHHRKGVLTFKPFSPRPGSLTLKIQGIGSAEREFSWELK